LNISWIFIAKKSSHKKECRIVKGWFVIYSYLKQLDM
jgi:hypothetical protein